MKRLKDRILQLEAQLAAARVVVKQTCDDDDQELVGRLELAAPVIQAGMQSVQPETLVQSRRNTAEHNYDVAAADIATASQPTLNRWQRQGGGRKRRRRSGKRAQATAQGAEDGSRWCAAIGPLRPMPVGIHATDLEDFRAKLWLEDPAKPHAIDVDWDSLAFSLAEADVLRNVPNDRREGAKDSEDPSRRVDNTLLEEKSAAHNGKDSEDLSRRVDSTPSEEKSAVQL